MRLKKGDIVRKSNGSFCYGPLLLVVDVDEEFLHVQWMLSKQLDTAVLVPKQSVEKMKIVSLRITNDQYTRIVNKAVYIDHELNKTWIKASYADETTTVFKLYCPYNKSTVYCTVYEITRLRKISPLKEILKVRLYPKTILAIV